MSLNKSKGNMYSWTTHTWNPIRGKCPHGCIYCFMKDRDVGSLRLEKKTLADNLGSGRTIFVGSSTDMFAEAVPTEWILQVLKKCKEHDNTYIFQSKNPRRFWDWEMNKDMDLTVEFPSKTILGTTLESNREYGQSGKGPPAWIRAANFMHTQLERFKKMVSIEPIIAFDLDIFLGWLKGINPSFVSIGADSKGHDLQEPTARELDDLVVALRGITEVKLKKNLARLILSEKK